jgi:hypothetical protein
MTAVLFLYLLLYSGNLANCHLRTQQKNYSAYREASQFVIFITYYKHDEIKKEEMGEECK